MMYSAHCRAPMQTAHEGTNQLDLMQGQEKAILGYCDILHSHGIPYGPESHPRDFGDSRGPCGAVAGRTKNADACGLDGLGVWACPMVLSLKGKTQSIAVSTSPDDLPMQHRLLAPHS